MTVITFTGGSSLKLLQAIVFLMLLLHLRPALGFISSVGDADSDNIRCLDGERQALLKPKKGFLVAYGNLSSWGSGDETKHCCNWKGVHCSNQTGHVLELRLGFSYLGGVISEAKFSNLSKLRHLQLSDNSLTLEFDFNWAPPFQLDEIYLRSCKLGPTFPNWILTQSNVTTIDISHAEISDTIPTEWFSNLPPKLVLLNLSCNQVHGLLPNVSKMPLNAHTIDLNANHLEGPLPLFSTNLSSLSLSKNQFSGSLTPLCKINGGLLGFLDLSDNLFSGALPNCFMHWPNLFILNLAGNNLSGEVPSSLGLLSMLVTLSLRNNNFSGDFPLSLKNCSSLKFMDLGNNKFSGKVPAWIVEGLPQLIVLILRSNKFNGSIPWHICQLKSGTIPQCLNNFTAMAHKGKSSSNLFDGDYLGTAGGYVCMGIYVDSAMVVLKGSEYEYGKLPSEISSLLELVVLNVSKNNLIGEIPQMISQLKQLESLDMSWNRFSREIPSSMSELQFLSHLDLPYNNLSGKIPSSTQLQGFDATHFIGNWALCGLPITQKCPSEETPSQSEPTDDGSKDVEKDKDEFKKWFYAGAGLGYIVSFWSVCGSLLLKQSWRHAYFLLLDSLKDWIYATMVVNKARLWKKFQNQG
ncbi:receptor-like protein EIX2 [Quercus robur]|uniref:receptor-like protein EIX2 n=1 Tax=Quercus robur TaxID=38942 RepID=UPI0021612828|nr:receptor-like protein EIX2 [Quercus robur]